MTGQRTIPEKFRAVDVDQWFAMDPGERREYRRLLWDITDGELDLDEDDLFIFAVRICAFHVYADRYEQPLRREDDGDGIAWYTTSYERTDLEEG